ncbi:MAG: DUF1638 domain-containing protein [Phycisphaerae bacterium]|nr:DUF1638 domain-containing protein [Phycisphaerae bacterium]
MMMSEALSHMSLHTYAVVACGTLSREIRHLADTGLLDGERVFFTAPGLHEWPKQLAKQLARQIHRAQEAAGQIIVAYGEKCYMDLDTAADTDVFLRAFGENVARVRAKNCVDMLADAEERARIAEGAKVYWLTPGWLEHWDYIFKDWDAAKANETFPANDKAIVLDAVGYFDEMTETEPEKILQISDWMKLDLERHATSLERLKQLLCECAQRLEHRCDAMLASPKPQRGRP